MRPKDQLPGTMMLRAARVTAVMPRRAGAAAGAPEGVAGVVVAGGGVESSDSPAALRHNGPRQAEISAKDVG